MCSRPPSSRWDSAEAHFSSKFSGTGMYDFDLPETPLTGRKFLSSPITPRSPASTLAYVSPVTSLHVRLAPPRHLHLPFYKLNTSHVT